MKQRLLILAAGAAIAFTACNSGSEEGSYSQAQIDSIASAKADSMAAALKMQNDSAIAAQAQKTADSLRLADSLYNAGKKNGTVTVVKKTTKPTSKPAPTKEDERKVVPPAVDKTDPSYRPGAKTTTNNESKEATAPKSVSDRPGAK